MSDEIKKLDIACGQRKQAGFIGVDCVALPGVDVVHDLMKFPWPFKDEEFDEIVCCHYIEHIPHNCACCADQPDPFFQFLDEVWRILKPKGKATFVAPYAGNVRADQDPTHCRRINEYTAFYTNKEWRDANKLDHYRVKCDFDFVSSYDVEPDWVSRSEESRQFAFRHYAGVVRDIHIVLTKRVPASA